MSPFNFFGIHNHFQGVLVGEDITFVTGGDHGQKKATLFIIEKDKEIKAVQLNKTPKHWHAGSFQKYKDSLIIPIETLSTPYTSEIISFDLKSQKIKTLFLKKTNKTGAIDIVTHNNEDYIFLFDPEEISIYKFPSFEVVKSLKRKIFTGSSAKVIKDCYGSFFIVNITNNGIFPPILNNENILEIYSLDFKSFETKKLKEIEIKCNIYNLRGAANLQLTKEGMMITSTSMYLGLFNKELFLDVIKNSN